ncbi:hypothetical protein PPTG_17720 [Phytophthora nicotianae INRA-310]|uniref:Uncharacterized protein n=1 Tax=Phytophthora nicotianae (strain INRA-310) TaxID=761204 RepID=W2PKH7_PHYN3|nr:hypothetical protein PPTG_17720 [Phytophthora nicotianae INRA-310]ETN00749.1 hypothetical protein PPTG_17720 [Phytophthora nicotianae INRA-310]
MDAGLLFHYFAKPMEWLIRLHDSVPPLGEWRDDLMDESNVRGLIESAPWEILAAKIDPLAFQDRGWFRHMMRLYTHAFPVSIAKRRANRLLRGYCDLDLLLDPFFLQFPRPGEAEAWYPGIDGGADPADLLEALAITDAADRWRNHYRDVPGNHPALEIARLPGKFVSSSS